MQIELEPSLQRWVDAAILDPRQASRIREFETAAGPHRRSRLPVLLGLVFGGLMLAAGVLLFVSAHWDELSPVQRMSMLVGAVGGFHVAGALFAERFRAMAITLHAVGSVALGGAIFLAGQIFNMQEHWPAGIMVWALGAVAGWLLLGDWPQLALAAILVPFWLVGEWTEAMAQSPDGWQIATAGILLLALSYLSVRSPAAPAANDSVLRSFTWIGGIALLPAALSAGLASHLRYGRTSPTGMSFLGWICALLLPLAFAYVFRRDRTWINVVAAVWVVILSWMAHASVGALIYLWAAIGAAGLIAWGVYELRAERINLGMAAFALTVLLFFFSNMMDRLDRSAGLIALGTVFLAGGWYWEKLRRRLVGSVQSGEIG